MQRNENGGRRGGLNPLSKGVINRGVVCRTRDRHSDVANRETVNSSVPIWKNVSTGGQTRNLGPDDWLMPRAIGNPKGN